ncbi:MAG: type I-E CRISPR-associated protein Cas6/Cse3/CasE [Verrucomicrobia bacterium]|jgi:CRISPR system Cascade subunit CasE|nr:MAG: type I-E CRISPR-associated protein Cas6/Cse3/CasE [Verrucomicrobiota bacterium]
MSYLTQILVPYELAVRQLKIRDSYDWHQRVWQAFKGRDGEKRDFLSRVDEADEAYRLLIVSPAAPSKPDWCPADCFKTKAMPDDFFTAGRFRFSLLVNPTRKVRGDKDGNRTKNGRRLPVTKRAELIAWLQRKAEKGGFEIGDAETLRTTPKPRSYFQKGATQGVHYAAEFQGVLTVTDPALFRTTFTTGIGSAKAFGFGLLALAPIS